MLNHRNSPRLMAGRRIHSHQPGTCVEVSVQMTEVVTSTGHLKETSLAPAPG